MKSLILIGAGLTLAVAGCVAPGRNEARGNYSNRTVLVFEEDDYDYYPGYETYYSRAHGYFYYRDRNTWVRRNDPPRSWVRGAPSVQVHFQDAPDRHHVEMVQRYPKNWRAEKPKGSAQDHRDHDERDDHGKHDRDRDRDQR